MIGVRVECDFEGCGRHTVIGGHELNTYGAGTLALGGEPVAGRRDRRPRIPYVGIEGELRLPMTWAATFDRTTGAATVYCADHAGEA